MPRLDQGTIEKLAKKLKKPVKYIKEQLSKKASKNQVKAESYLVKWAKDEGIGCQRYFNTLSPDLQRQVQELSVRKPSISNSKQVIKRIHNHKVFKVGNLTIQPTGKLLIKAMLAEAEKNANLYPELYFFENSLRQFIDIVLTKKSGKDWWNQVNKTIRDKVAGREKKEKMNPWHGSRGIKPIYYTDLLELCNILRANESVFLPFFKDVTGGLNWLTQKLEEMYHTRNNIAHSAPLKDQDITRFKTYFSDWYQQLQHIEESL